MTMEKLPMTAAGYSVLEAELKHRQQVERPRIIQQITDARNTAIFPENAEYHAAKEQQSLNEGAHRRARDKLARAGDRPDVSKLSGDTITRRHRHTDRRGHRQEAGVASWASLKPMPAGKISGHLARRLRALINKKKGDTVEVVDRAAPRPTRDRQGGMAVERKRRARALILE